MRIDNIRLMAIILQVLGVDGKLTDDEIDVVQEEAILLGINDKAFKKVIDLINNTKDPGDILKGINTFEEKLFTLQEIFKVVHSKKSVSRLEREAIKWIADSFKLSDKLVGRLESIVKRIRRLSNELDKLYRQCKL